jgi:hypothetical protein
MIRDEAEYDSVELVPNGRDRIAEIVKRLVNEPSLGVQNVVPLAWDVIFGNFAIPTPQGAMQITGYAIMITARLTGPGGAMLVGRQQTIAQAHAFQSTVPTDQEVAEGFNQCLVNLRTQMDVAAAAAAAGGNRMPPLSQ